MEIGEITMSQKEFGAMRTLDKSCVAEVGLTFKKVSGDDWYLAEYVRSYKEDVKKLIPDTQQEIISVQKRIDDLHLEKNKLAGQVLNGMEADDHPGKMEFLFILSDKSKRIADTINELTAGLKSSIEELKRLEAHGNSWEIKWSKITVE